FMITLVVHKPHDDTQLFTHFSLRSFFFYFMLLPPPNSPLFPYTTLFRSLEGLLAQQPGLKVVIPSTPYDAKGLLISAIRNNDPVIFLEHMKLYRSFREEV